MNYEEDRVQRVLATGGSLKLKLVALDGTETPANTKWLNINAEQGRAIAAVFADAPAYELTTEQRQQIHELADAVVNAGGYADEPSESDRRASERDALEARIAAVFSDEPSPLQRIADMLAEPNWSVGMLEDIAEIVSGAGVAPRADRPTYLHH
jgi:hypothetical protein